MDEQRSRRGRGNKEHAGADASGSRKTGRAAGCFGREERDPVAVADANSDDRSQAEPDSNAEEFAETNRQGDSETDAEEKRRAQGHTEAISEKGEGRFRKEIRDSEKESSASSNQTSDKTDSSAKGSGNETKQPSELAWYGTMLHDRFHKAWEQPKSIVATGAKMSTIVKIRIEKDGRVSKFTIVKPSGNVVVDESVAAIAQRVTQVDPLPEGLAKGAYYEVKIDFELNAEK